MKLRFIMIALAALLVLAPRAYPQQAPSSAGAGANGSVPIAAGSTEAGSTETVALSPTYRSVTLGMGMDEVKAALLADPIFGYRGDRDVSLLPTMNRTLIETSGYSFIKRSWFQFRDDSLYIMTFSLDPALVDYYSVYKGLVSKYGEPTSLDPHKATWADSSVTLTLERPLTVKYVDTAAFAEIMDSSGAARAASDILREDFVNGF